MSRHVEQKHAALPGRLSVCVAAMCKRYSKAVNADSYNFTHTENVADLTKRQVC